MTVAELRYERPVDAEFAALWTWEETRRSKVMRCGG